MANQVYELLVKAKDLIKEEKNWIQGGFAQDATGKRIDCTDETAVCFCSIGALRAVDGDICTEDYLTANFILRACMDASIFTFNDNYTHTQVMQAWDRAIEAAKQSS